MNMSQIQQYTSYLQRGRVCMMLIMGFVLLKKASGSRQETLIIVTDWPEVIEFWSRVFLPE